MLLLLQRGSMWKLNERSGLPHLANLVRVGMLICPHSPDMDIGSQGHDRQESIQIIHSRKEVSRRGQG